MAKQIQDNTSEESKEFSININTGTVYIFDIIDSKLVHAVCAALPLLVKHNKNKVVFKLNSSGGNLSDTIALMSEMKQWDIEFHADILGMAYSSAAYLAMACDYVKMSRAASFMIHYPLWETELKSLHEHNVDVKSTSTNFDAFLKDLAKRTTMTFTQIKKELDSGDFILSAEKAKKLGIVDEVY